MTKPLIVSSTLLNRATSGHAPTQFKLAQMYMESEHEDDNALAEEWALKAAINGHVEAMYWLGEGYVVYAKELLEEDPDESKTYFEHAYHWLKQASEAKHAGAILELAGFYRRGDIVEKDIDQSIKLVKEAAELGDVQAMRDLACIYEHGLGIEIDLEQADFWLAKAENTKS